MYSGVPALQYQNNLHMCTLTLYHYIVKIQGLQSKSSNCSESCISQWLIHYSTSFCLHNSELYTLIPFSTCESVFVHSQRYGISRKNFNSHSQYNINLSYSIFSNHFSTEDYLLPNRCIMSERFHKKSSYPIYHIFCGLLIVNVFSPVLIFPV